jgi:hypothetical protein
MPARLARAFKTLLGPRLPLVGAVHVCAACGGGYVNPVAWDEAGDERWLVALRCGACAYEHTRELSLDEAQELLTALDRGFSEIEAAADRLERELMAGWVETFATALRRGLFDAGDFASRPSPTLRA